MCVFHHLLSAKLSTAYIEALQVYIESFCSSGSMELFMSTTIPYISVCSCGAPPSQDMLIMLLFIKLFIFLKNYPCQISFFSTIFTVPLSLDSTIRILVANLPMDTIYSSSTAHHSLVFPTFS
jgi:hypothetical protein